MDRRNFFKILSATSAGALTTACGSHSDKLIPLLVPEREIVPGEEQWHPAVCTECDAGCGTLVRIMEGVRTIERDGQQFRERIAAVKKIEGNPLDPVSGGRLCARGQAAVQSLYHPDRLRGPMKRTGDRGAGQFTAISWQDAIAQAAESLAKARAANPAGIVFLTSPSAGTRSVAIERFLEALGAPAPVVCSIADFSVEHKAAEIAFGWKGLPVYDLARAHHVLGVGADFLGGWVSPVYYNRQFGAFRQGRREVRGRLVHAESRMSLTAGAADRWLPIRPGTEPQFLAAVGRLLLDAGLAHGRGQLPKGVAAVFESANPAALLATCGVDERRVREAVQELGESSAPLVLAGASVPHTNSLDAVLASHYVNVLLGNVGKPGGLMAPAESALAPPANNRAQEALAHAQVVLIDGANPAYTLPRSAGALDALTRAATVIAFGGFIDDTSAFADLLLPDHHALERDTAVVPALAPQPSVTVSTAFVQPLYDTRPVEKTLADLAQALKIDYKPGTAKEMLDPISNGVAFDEISRQGGLWLDAKNAEAPRVRSENLEISAAQFPGDAGQFPLLFQPYPSLQYHDGRGANLPWLQELPDPVSSSIWGLPVEIDPGTAAALRVVTGDIVRVESPHGYLEASVYVHPGAFPGVVSMAIGDGHTHYGRYASARGANPLAILAPVWEKSSGALALGATRVKVSRAGGPRRLIQFAAPDREERGFDHR